MSGFDITKYRAMFQEEAVELFSNIDNVLLKAEEDGRLDDDDMNSLFRYVHTLKGSSASVELGNFARFTHEVESFMDKLRNKILAYQPEMAALLIDCTDAMKTLLDAEIDETLTSELFDELTVNNIAAIKEMSEGDQQASPKMQKPKPDENESFGFFDDSFVSDNTDNEESFGIVGSHEYDGFGFFDTSYEQVAAIEMLSAVNEEHFGFFDENLQARIEDDTAKSDNTDSSAQLELTKTIANEPLVASTPSDVVLTTAQKTEFTKTTTPAPSASTDVKAGNSIRVDLSKIDVLMNNVGELVIVNSMLFQLAEDVKDAAMRSLILEKLKLLDRHTRELQDSVMSVRMVPMDTIYSKFPKTVRDVSKKLGKKVDFKHAGDNVEIDKAMIEGLTDPLMHIVRNSLDHGLEMPEDRKLKGKPETGTIMINAEQANGQILISISDDGNGIPADKVALKALERGVIDKARYDQMSNEEKVMLIFAPGLSTAEAVTDLSGRGVGMDVVKTNITKLGGTIGVTSEIGVGTTMTIALPLTLAILDGLNIAIGDKSYILPLASIIESLQPKEDMVKRIGDGKEELLMLRSEFIPVVRLYKLFNIEPKYQDLSGGMLIVVRTGKQKLALFVDEFLHQQQVVVKPIDKNFRSVKGIGGATVRGDGSIGLIIDVIGILDEQRKFEKRRIK